jgi:biopolymer transport protein ExbD
MEMTPMIDVTFLLLVFFLCTLRFKPLEGKLNAYLPKDTGQAYQPSEPEPELRVRVAVLHPGSKVWAGDSSGRTAFDPRDPRHLRFAPGADRELQWSVGARRSAEFSEFAAALRDQARVDDGRPVVLDVQPGVHTGEAVRVLDALQAVGFGEVRFAPARSR